MYEKALGVPTTALAIVPLQPSAASSARSSVGSTVSAKPKTRSLNFGQVRSFFYNKPTYLFKKLFSY
jgi:hypothetical protein